MTRRSEPRISDLATHPRRFVSLTVAAEYLECHRVTLHKWLDEGLLAYTIFGRRRKIAIADLQTFEQRRRVCNVSRENVRV